MEFEGTHIIGYEAGALATIAMGVALLLWGRCGPRRKDCPLETRRLLREVHIYAGTAALTLAIAHATGSFLQSLTVELTQPLGLVAGVAAVVLLVSGFLRLRPPARWRSHQRLLAGAHSALWITMLVFTVLHSVVVLSAGLTGPRTVRPALHGRAIRSGSLLIVLLPSINLSGTVHARIIRTAELLDTAGRVTSQGAHTASTAEFDLRGQEPVTQFLRLNKLSSHLIPVPLSDHHSGETMVVFVSPDLAHAVLGNPADPTHIIRTWPWDYAGQPVVRYSDSRPVTPERHAYSLLSLVSDPPRLTTRVLGSDEPLSALAVPAGVHDPATWLIGQTNHGRQDPSSCTSCHGSPGDKPPLYGDITTGRGWCFKCHAGPAGPAAGMVDGSL